MSKPSDPIQPKSTPSQAVSASGDTTRSRRITVTLTPRAASIVAHHQAENGVSKTRAIEELILQSR